MRTTILFIIALFASISVIGSTNDLAGKGENTFIGTYKGLTEDYEFKFVDEKGKVIILQEVREDIEINLYDEKTIDKKFKVTWEETIIELTDDEGETTGETQKTKTITALEDIE